MLIESFLAAIALIVWCKSEPGPLQFHAGNVVIAATLHTLMFNINPLMRFDGYYMLVDWLEIPNLFTRGRQFVVAIGKRMCFGVRAEGVRETTILRAMAVRCYGVASLLWQALICVTLTLAAMGLVEGVGPGARVHGRGDVAWSAGNSFASLLCKRFGN